MGERGRWGMGVGGGRDSVRDKGGGEREREGERDREREYGRGEKEREGERW